MTVADQSSVVRDDGTVIAMATAASASAAVPRSATRASSLSGAVPPATGVVLLLLALPSSCIAAAAVTDVASTEASSAGLVVPQGGTGRALQDGDGLCCSFDFVSCAGDDWCDQSVENCLLSCDGWYVPPGTFEGTSPPGGECTTARWGECNDAPEFSTWDEDSQEWLYDNPCCGPSRCVTLDDGWRQCDVPDMCCSWDMSTCGVDPSCNGSEEACSSCGGYYIAPRERYFCTPLWYSCSTDDECCGAEGGASCLTDGDGWQHCNLPENIAGGGGGGDSETTSPTPQPPLDGGDETSSPTPQPPEETEAPVAAPTSPVPTIYTAPDDDGGDDDDDDDGAEGGEVCPHDEVGLVPWEELFPSLSSDQDVDLPDDTRVHISASVGTRLGLVTVPSTSELIIGNGNDSGEAIAFDVAGLEVMGKLTIGSEACPITGPPVIITLHGSRPTSTIDVQPTYKGILVHGNSSVLSLHGDSGTPTWTRLAETAETGDTSVTLQDDVSTSWMPGDSILVVTTAMKDSQDWHQNEVLLVESVEQRLGMDGAVDGSIVYLQSALSYRHVAIEAYQAEVGLLTRSIVIQGSAEDSDPTDAADAPCTSDQWHWGDSSAPCTDAGLTGFGGHVMLREGAKGYVEGVEFVRMGQTNVLGRYPLHFHVLGDGCPECYAKANSFHQSYYRCISIHGTNNLTVAWNVAYDVKGYCYYLEDGVEEYNRLHYNLVAHVHMIGPEVVKGTGGQETILYRQSDRLLLPADVTASGFYITNVRNELIGNAASGGWSGFAFPNLPAPLGVHRDLNKRPSSAVPLPGNTLDGNTAHSTAWWWYHAGAFYFGGTLMYEDEDTLGKCGFLRPSRDPCSAIHDSDRNPRAQCTMQGGARTSIGITATRASSICAPRGTALGGAPVPRRGTCE
jgi:hypothetical protein